MEPQSANALRFSLEVLLPQPGSKRLVMFTSPGAQLTRLALSSREGFVGLQDQHLHCFLAFHGGAIYAFGSRLQVLDNAGSINCGVES